MSVNWVSCGTKQNWVGWYWAAAFQLIFSSGRSCRPFEGSPRHRASSVPLAHTFTPWFILKFPVPTWGLLLFWAQTRKVTWSLKLMSLSILRYVCAAKSTIEKLKSPKMFFADGNFLYSRHEICCFHDANFVADGNFFIVDWHFRKNFLLLFLKTVYQYLFTFASVFVLHKAG